MRSVWKVHPEQVPRETMFWAMKQVSINLKGWISYKNEFFDQRGIKLEVTSRKTVLRKKTWVKEEITKEIRKYFKVNKVQCIRFVGCSKAVFGGKLV